MLRLLLYLLAPGDKLPEGATQFSFEHEGLSWGWAFFIFVGLVAAVSWSYVRFAPALTRFSRVGLIVLRSILIGLLLFLLVRPVLLITLEETIRRPLLVLLDTTQSMTLFDRRSHSEDLARAALARGLIDPAGGLNQALPGADALKDLSRHDLLEALAANPKLNLWPRLQARSSLSFYGFGRKLTELGDLAPPENGALTTDESAAFFHAVHSDEDLTAVGDGLRDLLDAQRGQPIAGILLITDGASNTGSSPEEAASIAREDGVPLFIYGIGVTSPQDIMVAELDGPQVSNVKERLNMTVHIRAQSMIGRKATVQLKANGKVVDEEPLEFRADGDQEVTVGYTPDEVGLADLEAYVPPLPEEAVKDNNSAKTQVRIVDDKIKILFVDEEPSWDFQYLLAMMQRDRRITVKCVLLKGDPDLSAEPDSPFLDRIPDDKATLFANDLVIIGDVDPADLGDARMKLLNEWVSKMGGGLLFHAGPKFDPGAYHDTPLEPMLPVETESKTADEYEQPVQLKLTPAGETSPLLMLSQNPQENLALWNGFPGVRWTAWVDQARPGAQVLLVDPTPSRANRAGPMPVIALQSYGVGQSLFVGFMETGVQGRDEGADAAVHPRRTDGAGHARVRHGAADVCVARVCGAERKLSRQHGAGAWIQPGDQRGLGQQGGHGPDGRGGRGGRYGQDRCGQAGGGRMELRRHPDRLHDCVYDTVQAASSGAGMGNLIVLYGIDEYILQYENEIGPPWKNPELYVKLSYPFFHADKIKDADAVHGWRQGFQRAARRRGADVPGAEERGDSGGADCVSGAVPRVHAAELYQGQVRAVDGLVRQVSGDCAGTGCYTGAG